MERLNVVSEVESAAVGLVAFGAVLSRRLRTFVVQRRDAGGFLGFFAVTEGGLVPGNI